MCAANAWIIYNDLRRENKKNVIFNFSRYTCETTYSRGDPEHVITPPRRGPQSKKMKLCGTIPLHLPVEGPTRRKCTKCSQEKRQTRTKTLCQKCNIPLCKDCLLLYHVI